MKKCTRSGEHWTYVVKVEEKKADLVWWLSMVSYGKIWTKEETKTFLCLIEDENITLILEQQTDFFFCAVISSTF